MSNGAVRTFQGLLARYTTGERSFVEAELDSDASANLNGVRLDEIDLSRAWIVADFRGASLRKARFVRANVKTCDFTGCDLRGADFSGAALCATTFKDALLEGATFAGAFAYSRELHEGELPDW